MDKEGSMDLSGAFAKLLENPEALKSALGIASALKDSGALEGLSKATGEEYKGGESAYNEENSHEKTQRAPFVPSEERSSAPVGDDGKRRKQLLMALRPYMNTERQEKIDTMLRILQLLELASKLGFSIPGTKDSS